MYRPLQMLCVVLVVGASARAQPPNPPLPTEEERLDRVLDHVKLVPAAVSFEIDYEGSPHTGCYQTMRAIAVYKVYDEDGFVWEERVNVSGECGWTFGNPAIYTAYTGEFGNLTGDGLVVSWEWGPDHAGSTGVTVTYEGKSASGTIRATDSRPPE